MDAVDDIEEGARLVEQGVYEVAVTSRTPPEPGKPETLAQRLLRLSPDSRRRVFVILVGEEFRTADGTQAWVAQADLVVHPNDAARCEHLIRSTLTERKRLYQPFVDARRKIESGLALAGFRGGQVAADHVVAHHAVGAEGRDHRLDRGLHRCGSTRAAGRRPSRAKKRGTTSVSSTR